MGADYSVNSGNRMGKPSVICGMDEVGRGPLAGPLVAAAVVLPPDFDFRLAYPALNFGDSKKLNALQ